MLTQYETTTVFDTGHVVALWIRKPDDDWSCRVMRVFGQTGISSLLELVKILHRPTKYTIRSAKLQMKGLCGACGNTCEGGFCHRRACASFDMKWDAIHGRYEDPEKVKWNNNHCQYEARARRVELSEWDDDHTPTHRSRSRSRSPPIYDRNIEDWYLASPDFTSSPTGSPQIYNMGGDEDDLLDGVNIPTA